MTRHGDISPHDVLNESFIDYVVEDTLRFIAEFADEAKYREAAAVLLPYVMVPDREDGDGMGERTAAED